MHIVQNELDRFSTLGLITLYKPLAKNLNYGIIIMYPIEVQENKWKLNDNERGIIMKALPNNFASTLYNNLNEVNFVQTIRKSVTAFYNDTPDQPTSLFNDDGDRILMKDVISVSVNDNYLYIEDFDDLVIIWRPNKTERRYTSIEIFDVTTYKNTTSLSMAIAIRIMKYYNDLLL